MRARLAAFGRFWYDFIIGDDWRVAAVVVVALGITAAISQTSVPAWWVLPIAVAVTLTVTVKRAARAR